MLVAVLLMGSVAATLADAALPAGVPTEDGMRAFALQWLAQMQAGKIDRTQYTAAYGAQFTDAEVQAMSHHLNEYGASPLRAEIMQKRSVDNQTLYQVKLLFPRGRCGQPSVRLRRRGQDHRRRYHEHGRRLNGALEIKSDADLGAMQ
jgi:hypothetical protein